VNNRLRKKGQERGEFPEKTYHRARDMEFKNNCKRRLGKTTPQQKGLPERKSKKERGNELKKKKKTTAREKKQRNIAQNQQITQRSKGGKKSENIGKKEGFKR